MKRAAVPTDAPVGRRPARPRRASDVFIVVAMGIVVFAVATALNRQLGIDLNVAIALGTVAYAALLGIHWWRGRHETMPAQRARDPEFEAFDRVHDRLSRRPPPLPDEAMPDLAHLSDFETRPTPRVAQVALPPLTAEHRGRPGVATASGQTRPGAPRPFQPQDVEEFAPTAQEPAIGTGDLESDVERIQALVKKLATEISAADDAVVERPRSHGRLPRAEAGIDASVNALRTTASGMRSAGMASPAPASVRPPAGPPPLSAAQAQIAAVADSLVAGRVDVELEPILSLLDQRTSHYEVSVNVHGVNGERLVENGGFAELHGTGLLPLLDSARLSRSVSIAQRLQEKSKKGRVFSAYSAESLTSPSFLSDARAALQDRGAVGGQLVAGFKQSDVRGFGAAEWAAIAELRNLHVVFALDRLSALDLDLKRLVSAGFTFVRVESVQFLGGLRFGGRAVSGPELVRYVTGSGMTLIADNVDSEDQLVRLGKAGVQLGQGKVFGGRRAVKVGAARDSHAA